MITTNKIMASFLSVALLLSATACDSSQGNVDIQPETSDTGNSEAEPDSNKTSDNVLCEDSIGGYTARLVLGEIVTYPSDEFNAYQAEGVQYTLTDESGDTAITLMNMVELMDGLGITGVWADCTEDAVRLYEIEWKGEKKYVLRCYLSYGTENGAYPNADPELYHARFYVGDLDAVISTGGSLRPYNIYGREEGDFYISDSLVYKGENVLYDEKTQTELTFDPDNYKADYLSLGEE